MLVGSVSSLTLAILWLTLFGGSNGECCTDKAKLLFTMSEGTCGELNAMNSSLGCEVTVCGDGKAIVGTFCGKGPCNIFGCNCDGGCLHGDYAQTFVSRNARFGIQVISAQMTTSRININMGQVSELVISFIAKR